MKLHLEIKLESARKQLTPDEDPFELFNSETDFVRMFCIIFGFKLLKSDSIRHVLTDKFMNVEWSYTYFITTNTDFYRILSLKGVVDTFCSKNGFTVVHIDVDPVE
jgi:hypothetical protein